MNKDSGLRRYTSQQYLQIAPAKRDAARRGCKPWARDMDENSAAPAGNAGPRVVVDFDNEIIETVDPAQAVAWFIGRTSKWPVIAPIGWVLAPGVHRADGAPWQPGRWPQPAVSSPPQSKRVEAAARGNAIALALTGPDARAAERDRHSQRTCK